MMFHEPDSQIDSFTKNVKNSNAKAMKEPQLAVI